MDWHDTVGVDLVNHRSTSPRRLASFIFPSIISAQRGGTALDQLPVISRACRAAGCALIGGVRQESPGRYDLLVVIRRRRWNARR